VRRRTPSLLGAGRESPAANRSLAVVRSKLRRDPSGGRRRRRVRARRGHWRRGRRGGRCRWLRDWLRRRRWRGHRRWRRPRYGSRSGSLQLLVRGEGRACTRGGHGDETKSEHSGESASIHDRHLGVAPFTIRSQPVGRFDRAACDRGADESEGARRGTRPQLPARSFAPPKVRERCSAVRLRGRGEISFARGRLPGGNLIAQRCRAVRCTIHGTDLGFGGRGPMAALARDRGPRTFRAPGRLGRDRLAPCNLRRAGAAKSRALG
jgi:hypothetical protein